MDSSLPPIWITREYHSERTQSKQKRHTNEEYGTFFVTDAMEKPVSRHFGVSHGLLSGKVLKMSLASNRERNKTLHLLSLPHHPYLPTR
jgi:hypothetical protein